MHPISSSRHHLNTTDTHGRAAYKLLALVPVSCDPPATPITPRRRPSSSMTPQVGRDFGCQKLHLLILQLSRRSPVHSPAVTSSQSYLAYLTDARAVIRTTARECSGWRRRYDGREGIVATDRIAGGGAEVAGDPLENEVLMGETTAVGPGSLEASSGYLSGSWSEGAAKKYCSVQRKRRSFGVLSDTVLTHLQDLMVWQQFSPGYVKKIVSPCLPWAVRNPPLVCCLRLQQRLVRNQPLAPS